MIVSAAVGAAVLLLIGVSGLANMVGDILDERDARRARKKSHRRVG